MDVSEGPGWRSKGKRLGVSLGVSFCLPLLFRGENGLKVVRGAVTFKVRGVEIREVGS